jgi:ribosomal protein S18 acetylase RimI-like enzyme
MQVQSRYRGCGLGQRLLYRRLAEARERGATMLYLLVFEDNVPAVRLYRKHGFTDFSHPRMDPVLSRELELTGRRRLLMSRPL